MVVFDVRMFDMDGVEIFLVIREKYFEILVIMMSGYGSLDLVVNVLCVGVVDFIEKFVGMEWLLVSLRNVLEIIDLKWVNRDFI